MLQFDLQFYEELTVARVQTIKFISGAFFLADRLACFVFLLRNRIWLNQMISFDSSLIPDHQLMGLAVYNSIILDIRFPAICYKKLLSPAVVPYNNPRATVGVASVSIDDLEATKPVCSQLLTSLILH